MTRRTPRALIIPADTGPFRGSIRFNPTGSLYRYGTDDTGLYRNPVEREGVVKFVARAFIGFNVGKAPRWKLDEIISMYEDLRLEQGESPDATFFVTKGLYTSNVDGSLVREDGCQILTFQFGGQRAAFENQMAELYEKLVAMLDQEVIYVELQKNGIPYEVFKVTPPKRIVRRPRKKTPSKTHTKGRNRK